MAKNKILPRVHTHVAGIYGTLTEYRYTISINGGSLMKPHSIGTKLSRKNDWKSGLIIETAPIPD